MPPPRDGTRRQGRHGGKAARDWPDRPPGSRSTARFLGSARTFRILPRIEQTLDRMLLVFLHHLFHLARELLQGKGLRQKMDPRAEIQVAAEPVLGVAGDEDHLEVRTFLAELSGQAWAVHRR